jgi:fibronectin type 3 domain-containing protein
VTLSWNADTSSVSGYNVYRGTQAGGESTNAINGATAVGGTSFVDSNVTAGTTYYYAVTAVMQNGTASTLSNEVSVVIP